MAVWSVTSSPLFVSADLRHLSEEAAAILLNKQAIAISQDPLGIMGQIASVVSLWTCAKFQILSFEFSAVFI